MKLHTVDSLSRGDCICSECWMWGCHIDDDTCLAEEGLSEEWPP